MASARGIMLDVDPNSIYAGFVTEKPVRLRMQTLTHRFGERDMNAAEKKFRIGSVR